MNNEQLKQKINEKYSEIACSQTSCCGSAVSGCCNTDSQHGTLNLETILEHDPAMMSGKYHHIDGYVASADLKLGCGLPVEHANIKSGETVVDLGSGAGNDCFIVRHLIGDKGKVIGIDFSQDMIDLAYQNVKKTGHHNMEFLLGEIGAIPLENAVADVVVSNCVMNLVPDKQQAFAETYRILKPGGHFSISDIVYSGTMPDEFREQVQLITGCVAGAIEKEAYLDVIKSAGFSDIEIASERQIDTTPFRESLPKELPFQVLSITVNASK